MIAAKPEVNDPFGIIGSAVDNRVVVTFGAVDASAAVRTVNVRHAVGELGSATFVLNPNAPVIQDIDFTAEVLVGHGDTEGKRRLFTGNVVSADPEDDGLRVECTSSPSLADPLPGAWLSNTAPLEYLYALIREGGVPEQRIAIEGLDRLPVQIFEVVAAVDGLQLSDRLRIGPVTFMPHGTVESVVSRLRPHDLVEQFLACSAFAVAYVTESRQLLAERAGLRLIDASIAWANLRLRFSGGAGPDGLGGRWNRAQLRQLATRSQLVAVRGLTTGGSWLRLYGRRPMTEAVLTASGGVPAALALTPSASHPRLRAAATAAARAASANDPLTRITAVSESLEFYVGRTELPKAFTKQDRKKLKNAAAMFPPDKKRRVEQLVGDLNKAPLLARLRYQLAVDGVPISEDDMALLARVREQRNDLVHGKRDQADDNEIDRAVSLLSRIVMYAAHSEARRTPAHR